MMAVPDREAWNRAVLSSLLPSFMQSWEWGEVQRHFGLRIDRLAIPGAQALTVQRPLPFSRSWLYVPRGPVVRRLSAVSELLGRVAALGRERRSVFIRIDPAVPENAADAAAWRAAMEQAGFVPAARQVQPQHTVIVEVARPDDGLLAAMHAKTRYNIRLAQRKGVTVRFSTAIEDLEHFLRLSGEVHARGSFRYHPLEYYRAMLETLGAVGAQARVELAVAEHARAAVAVHLLIFFGDTVTYAHGASSSVQRSLMAPHLLQWMSMLRAREQGARFYDLFGVAPPKAAADHPWAGITRFKEGFGGERVSCLGAYDLVLEPALYAGFNIARRLRRLL